MDSGQLSMKCQANNAALWHAVYCPVRKCCCFCYRMYRNRANLLLICGNKMQQRFLLQFLLLAQHVSGTTMPIIRSSRVLYSGCCLWHLVLWFSSCWSGVELRVMCPACRMLQHPASRTHNPQVKLSGRKFKWG